MYVDYWTWASGEGDGTCGQPIETARSLSWWCWLSDEWSTERTACAGETAVL